MELWIRSQDKNILQKANGLFIAHTDKNIFSIIDNINMSKYGTYTTKERALEVLDEIRDKIVINYGYELATNSGIRPDNIKSNNYTAVYEMPKD